MNSLHVFSKMISLIPKETIDIISQKHKQTVSTSSSEQCFLFIEDYELQTNSFINHLTSLLDDERKLNIFINKMDNKVAYVLFLRYLKLANYFHKQVNPNIHPDCKDKTITPQYAFSENQTEFITQVLIDFWYANPDLHYF